MTSDKGSVLSFLYTHTHTHAQTKTEMKNSEVTNNNNNINKLREHVETAYENKSERNVSVGIREEKRDVSKWVISNEWLASSK